MNAISTLNSAATNAPQSSAGFAELGGDDFLKLLITQLSNQDPLEPMGNEELLNQIASIRDIELSTTLTESIKSLAGQDRFASASTLIGQFVTGINAEDGSPVSGIVSGLRFTPDGTPIVQLSMGQEMPLDQIQTVQAPQQAAEQLVGQSIVGIDRRDAAEPSSKQGIVSGYRVETNGQVYLELDTGEDLRLTDLIGTAQPGPL